VDDTQYRIKRQKKAIRALLDIVPANRRTGVLHSLRSDALNQLHSNAPLVDEDPQAYERVIEHFYEKCDLFSVTEPGRRLNARRRNWFLIYWLCMLVVAAQVYLSSLPDFEWMNHGAWYMVVLPLTAAAHLTVIIGFLRDHWLGKKLKREDIQQMTSHRPELPHIRLHAIEALLEEHYQLE